MTARVFLWGLALAGLVTLALGAECDPQTTEDIELYATTGAPPTPTAAISERIDESDPPPSIELSRGVVLAVRCWDTCDFRCESPVLTVTDPTILSIREVDRLSSTILEMALIATQTGTTNLNVETSCASKTYTVTVLAD